MAMASSFAAIYKVRDSEIPSFFFILFYFENTLLFSIFDRSLVFCSELPTAKGAQDFMQKEGEGQRSNPPLQSH